MATHRHTPEIEEQLGYAAGRAFCLNFTPHLVPMNRGILVTAYASLTKDADYDTIRAPMKNITAVSISSASWIRMYARRRNGWRAATM